MCCSSGSPRQPFGPDASVPCANSPWLRVVVQMVLLLLPLAIAAGLAVVQAQKDATLGSDPYALNLSNDIRFRPAHR